MKVSLSPAKENAYSSLVAWAVAAAPEEKPGEELVGPSPPAGLIEQRKVLPELEASELSVRVAAAP
jgi:hypothetical protein